MNNNNNNNNSDNNKFISQRTYTGLYHGEAGWPNSSLINKQASVKCFLRLCIHVLSVTWILWDLLAHLAAHQLVNECLPKLGQICKTSSVIYQQYFMSVTHSLKPCSSCRWMNMTWNDGILHTCIPVTLQSSLTAWRSKLTPLPQRNHTEKLYCRWNIFLERNSAVVLEAWFLVETAWAYFVKLSVIHERADVQSHPWTFAASRSLCRVALKGCNVQVFTQEARWTFPVYYTSGSFWPFPRHHLSSEANKTCLSLAWCLLPFSLSLSRPVALCSLFCISALYICGKTNWLSHFSVCSHKTAAHHIRVIFLVKSHKPRLSYST